MNAPLSLMNRQLQPTPANGFWLGMVGGCEVEQSFATIEIPAIGSWHRSIWTESERISGAARR